MKLVAILFTTLLVTSMHATEYDFSGNTSIESRSFVNDALHAQQHDNYLSISFEPELYIPIKGNDLALTVTPFARLDQHDDERTHFDFRELFLYYSTGDWEWRVGLNKVFWGVAESQHLVDIINQTDLVEDLDGEDKLGQPMIQASWLQDWGALELFVMPYFRERTFTGEQGRPRFPLLVDDNSAQYESSSEEKHIDVALRLSGVVADVWDLGVYYFKGTDRNPQLLPEFRLTGPVLIPRYNQIEQVGFQAQATFESWLLKLEAISRQGAPDNYNAAVGGFEYTFYSLGDSSIDLGTLMEYHYDDRGDNGAAVFQNDLFAGVRLAFNDTQSSDLLMGGSFDLDKDVSFFRLEGNRRLGQSWKLSATAQIFNINDSDSIQYAFRSDDFLELTLSYFF